MYEFASGIKSGEEPQNLDLSTPATWTRDPESQTLKSPIESTNQIAPNRDNPPAKLLKPSGGKGTSKAPPQPPQHATTPYQTGIRLLTRMGGATPLEVSGGWSWKHINHDTQDQMTTTHCRASNFRRASKSCLSGFCAFRSSRSNPTRPFDECILTQNESPTQLVSI
jgi:hypothetical protein